jgi:hypothetical protein
MNSILSYQSDAGSINPLELLRFIFIFLFCVCTEMVSDNFLTVFPNKISVMYLYLFNLWIISVNPLSAISVLSF